jgi:hypothetical protein
MAGCFGNSIFDRCMESQLNDYLNSGADYEGWIQEVSEKVSNEFWDNGYGDWFESGKRDTSLDYLYNKGYSCEKASELLVKLYINKL